MSISRPIASDTSGKSWRCPVWKRNGSSPSDQELVEGEPGGRGDLVEVGGEAEDVGCDLVDAGGHGELLCCADRRRSGVVVCTDHRRERAPTTSGLPPIGPPTCTPSGSTAASADAFRLVNDAAARGSRLGARPHTELGEHATDVVLDRLRGEEQRGRDLGVRASVAHEIEHLPFPCGERGHSVRERRRVGTRRRRAEASQHRRALVAQRCAAQPTAERVRCPGRHDRCADVARRLVRPRHQQLRPAGEQRRLAARKCGERLLCGLHRVGGAALRQREPGCRRVLQRRDRRRVGGVAHRHQQLARGAGRIEVTAGELRVDEQGDEGPAAQHVADELAHRTAQHGRGEVRPATAEVDEPQRTCGWEVVLDRREQLLRLVGAALERAQLGEAGERVDAVTGTSRAGWSERLERSPPPPRSTCPPRRAPRRTRCGSGCAARVAARPTGRGLRPRSSAPTPRRGARHRSDRTTTASSRTPSRRRTDPRPPRWRSTRAPGRGAGSRRAPAPG